MRIGPPVLPAATSPATAAALVAAAGTGAPSFRQAALAAVMPLPDLTPTTASTTPAPASGGNSTAIPVPDPATLLAGLGAAGQMASAPDATAPAVLRPMPGVPASAATLPASPASPVIPSTAAPPPTGPVAPTLLGGATTIRVTPGVSVRLPAALADAADRLSLSAEAVAESAAMGEDNRAPAAPAERFLRDLLAALTGEPDPQWRSSPAGLRAAVGSDYGLPDPRDAGTALRLLVQARVWTGDARTLGLQLHLDLQRPAGAPQPDLAERLAIRETLETLAAGVHDLDYPGPAAQLLGQTVRLDVALDPRGVWPLSVFYLSALLLIRDPAALALPEIEVPESSDAADDEAAPDSQSPSERGDPPRPRRRRRDPESALTPEPADGGLPIISGRRWLALELRHLQRQLRRWMLLPVGA